MKSIFHKIEEIDVVFYETFRVTVSGRLSVNEGNYPISNEAFPNLTTSHTFSEDELRYPAMYKVKIYRNLL